MTPSAPAPVDDAAARADALARYRGDVLAYCQRRLRSREDAEDAAQMIYLNAYRSLASGTVPRLELAWLYSIAENVVAYKWRTISRRREFEVLVDADDLAHLATTESADDAPDVSDVVEALSGLPVMERRALLLREVRGFSYREVGDELGVSNKAVERLLTRGRNGLRRNGRRIAGFGLPWPALKSFFSTGVVAKGLAGAASVALIVAAVPALKSGPANRTPVPKAAAQPRHAAPVAVPTWSRPQAAAVVVAGAKHHVRRARHAPAPKPSVGVLTPPAPVIAPDDTTTAPPPPADPTVTVTEVRSVADVSTPISPVSGTLEPDGGTPADPGNSGNHAGWANPNGNGPKNPDPATSGQ